MPNLPQLSGKEIIRALERLGFVQARQRGSHVVMKSPRQREVLVVLFLCMAKSQLGHCIAFSNKQKFQQMSL